MLEPGLRPLLIHDADQPMLPFGQYRRRGPMSGPRLSRREPEVGQQLTRYRANSPDDSAKALLVLGGVCHEAVRQLVRMAQRDAVTTGNLVGNNAEPFWRSIS
ncbi:hypothetical protein ACFYT3_03940 [Nocardia amikacinitolerans]|uniref:hypothetical protein n=1 Tax=Nocardia amikacinitolerans TaxID=756689 RepID=UPI003678BE85